ncbi:MAG: hypothetical protein ABFD82_02930 [Syntrophaceae bacterium]
MTSKIKSDRANQIPIDAKLKRLLFYYAFSALCATVLISGSILTEKYTTSLTDTLNKLQTLKINSIQMKEASKKMGLTVENIRSMLPTYTKTEAMEGVILTTLDSIKSNKKDVNITVTNFERKGDEIALPLTLTGTIRDYTTFINLFGYLQSLNLPLFAINDVMLSNQSDGKYISTHFEIRGALKMQSVIIGGSS